MLDVYFKKIIYPKAVAELKATAFISRQYFSILSHFSF